MRVYHHGEVLPCGEVSEGSSLSASFSNDTESVALIQGEGSKGECPSTEGPLRDRSFSFAVVDP